MQNESGGQSYRDFPLPRGDEPSNESKPSRGKVTGESGEGILGESIPEDKELEDLDDITPLPSNNLPSSNLTNI